MSKALAVITGASSGIGKEFALQLHEKGYDLLLVARRAELLKSLADELNAVRADSVQFQVVDLTRREELQELELVLQKLSVTLLVNNAGRGSFGEFDTLSLESEEEMVALNISATMRLAHAVLPGMKERKRGGLISISSIAGFQPLPFMATYAATKSFNLVHSLGLWYELRPYKVKVTVVCPGPTATEFGGVARVPGMVTGTGRSSVHAVVAESLRAYDKGRVVVIPCLKAKLLGTLSRITPVTLGTWITGKMLKPVLRAVTK
jgi:hypothetical protein